MIIITIDEQKNDGTLTTIKLTMTIIKNERNKKTKICGKRVTSPGSLQDCASMFLERP